MTLPLPTTGQRERGAAGGGFLIKTKTTPKQSKKGQQPAGPRIEDPARTLLRTPHTASSSHHHHHHAHTLRPACPAPELGGALGHEHERHHHAVVTRPPWTDPAASSQGSARRGLSNFVSSDARNVVIDPCEDRNLVRHVGDWWGQWPSRTGFLNRCWRRRWWRRWRWRRRRW